MSNTHGEWLHHFTWDSLNPTVLHLGKWRVVSSIGIVVKVWVWGRYMLYNHRDKEDWRVERNLESYIRDGEEEQGESKEKKSWK